VPVALKFIRLGEDAGRLERRALEFMKGIRNPHLVGISGAWLREDLLILAMELGDGTLSDKLKEAKSKGLEGIPIDELREFMRDAAVGLDYLNSLGIQHRDVKPQNLLVVGGGVKVADFGLAKILEHTFSSNSGSMTPAYAAPEFFGGQISSQSDQYSLAVTYCHLRGGRLPFVGNPAQVMMGHLMEQPDLTMLPDAEWSVVGRAMAKKPAERFANCREFVAALNGVLAGQVVNVRSAPAAPRESEVPPSQRRSTRPGNASGRAGASVRKPSVKTSVAKTASRRKPPFVRIAAALIFCLVLCTTLYVWSLKQSNPGQSSSLAGPTDWPMSDPEEVLQLVKEMAHRHVNNEKPMNSELALSTYGNKGLSSSNIVETYEKAYEAAKREATRVAGAEAGKTRPEKMIPQPTPDNLEIDLGGTKMAFIRIKAGSFTMGSPNSDEDALDDEKPWHRVLLTHDFYLGKCAVTRDEFARFVDDAHYKTEAEKDGVGGWGYNAKENSVEGPKPSYNWRNTGFEQIGNHPVVNVTWNDAKAFCDWLGRKNDKPCQLPSEAQWEYACRAGRETRYFTGDEPQSLEGFANVADMSLQNKGIKGFKDWRYFSFEDRYAFSSPVGSFKPNPWGLYDMTGNVWQWCADWYGDKEYSGGEKTDPTGPRAGTARVRRGGSWYYDTPRSRAALRNCVAPRYRDCDAGFRVLVGIDHPQASDQVTLDLGGGLKMHFVRIKAGSFMMGSPDSNEDSVISENEKPQHRVTLTRDFYLGRYFVTRKEFACFANDQDYKTGAEKDGVGGWGYNARENSFEIKPTYNWRDPGFEQDGLHPVVNVTWNDAKSFCDWLSKKSNRRCELPSEAQWEYACRAGTETRLFTGNGAGSLEGFANVADLSIRNKGIKGMEKWTYFPFDDHYPFTSPVGTFKPNPWGLCDMIGNVWQWCGDWYGEKYYAEDVRTDPVGPGSGTSRAVRGGSWYIPPGLCGAALRHGYEPGYSSNDVGFRVLVHSD
jgi:formylglycine-generating enzyme required for sulfatase activity/serine/threonine protein kinase